MQREGRTGEDFVALAFCTGLNINVVEARGGFSTLSRTTDLNRENLYRSLSKKGNPKFYSLTTILQAVGIELQFAPTQKKKRAA